LVAPVRQTQLLVETDDLIEIDYLLLLGKIYRNLGAPKTTSKVDRNKRLFGVNFPSAIAEALMTIRTASGQIIKDILLKVDSGASVSLAHSDYLTDMKHCKQHGMPPVRLNGIGGKTEIICQVGFLNIITSESKTVSVACYAFDTRIGDTKRLCLLSNWAIDHHNIDQPYHARTSLRVGPQKLRFTSEQQREYDRQSQQTYLTEVRKIPGATERPATPPSAPAPKRLKGADGKPKRPKGAKKVARPKKSARPKSLRKVEFSLGDNCYYDPATCKLYPDSPMVLKEYLAQFPVFTASAESAENCNCELRYAKSIVEETYDRIEDGTVKTAEQCHQRSSVLLCQDTAQYTDEQLLILEPGIMIIPEPLVMMSEIQLKGIQDRLGKLDLNQKTDGAEMMTKDGQTYSKFSYQAMELGVDVTRDMKTSIDRIFSDNVGEDAVFPTKNGAPKILTKYLHKPYSYELLPEYENGSKNLPSAKAQNWVGKEASSNIIRDFVQNTPIVEPCPHPRCVSRLVIVPKFAPGQPKSDPDHGFRVTVNALMNKCLKPCASTIPLATGEIIKLHHCNYYLQCDGLNAFWAIPVCDESKRLTAFHTPDGIYCFNRLLMGAKPSSAVQQSAYLEALDKYIDIDEEGNPRVDENGKRQNFRDRFALYCDDIACGSNSLQELRLMFEALISCFKRAGIQVKASKVKFGVSEITFHNYTITAQGTKPKEANLCPIRNMGIPTDVHQVKAFLGCCQQMSQYVEKYSIIAQPMHYLTKKGVIFPKPWISGAAYDNSFHLLKTAMLDGTNYSWNKDPNKRLFLEVDASDVGWGCCAFQFATPFLTEDEGQERLLDKSKRRVIEWISKAWTTDQLKLPVFYRESLARLLCLEKYRNLIETNIKSGITLYTDHMPSLYAESLSNKGQLSEWRIAEVADLNSIVQTLHQAGPRMALADPLSRLCSPSGGLYDMTLPSKLATLLQHLPKWVKNAKNVRVHTNKDTAAARRIIQNWRIPTNPISPAQLTSATKSDFIIGTPYADRGTLKISQLLKEDRAFAVLHPTSLINEIPVENTGINAEVAEKLKGTKKIVLSDHNLTWIINLPADKLEEDEVLEHMIYIVEPSYNQAQLLAKTTKTYPEFLRNATRVASVDVGCGTKEAHTVIDASLRALRSNNRIFEETNHQRRELLIGLRSGRITQRELQTIAEQSNRGANGPAPAPAVMPDNRTTHTLRSGRQFHTTPLDTEEAAFTEYIPPRSLAPVTSTKVPPFTKWVGLQAKDQTLPPEKLKYVKTHQIGYPAALKFLCLPESRPRIIVPVRYQERLIKATHEEILHLGYPKVREILKKLYFWPKMDEKIETVVRDCVKCLENTVRRRHLASHFDSRSKTKMHYPRHSYGIDFYGVANGEILTAVDLCTREVLFWWLPDRQQSRVANALITGLIFQRGVPVCLRSDNAPELMQGVVRDINLYLNIQQITTGGHNPRGNAICERVNQMVGSMLRKCSDAQYKNVKTYLPAMAFAINTTNSSTLKCTPFEAGHGLPARTVASARADSARIQFNAEGGTGDNTLEDISTHFDTSLQKAMLELSTRLADAVNSESEWHRRMTSEKLNMSGRKIALDLLKDKAKVYFYKPPSQQETIKLGRKAKHCQHYHGPAEIVRKIGTHSYVISYKGKTFQRDQGMIIPAAHLPKASARAPGDTPKAIKHTSGHKLVEGELVLLKGGISDRDWYCAEILEVLTDRFKVSWYTTPQAPLTNHRGATVRARKANLEKAIFSKTWIKRPSGLPTIIAPTNARGRSSLYTGRIPNNEIDQHLLIRNVALTNDGHLNRRTLSLAAALTRPHHQHAGGNDDFRTT
jgi:transposase InsO family protein